MSFFSLIVQGSVYNISNETNQIEAQIEYARKIGILLVSIQLKKLFDNSFFVIILSVFGEHFTVLERMNMNFTNPKRNKHKHNFFH